MLVWTIELTTFNEFPKIYFKVELYSLKWIPVLAGVKNQQQFTFRAMTQITHLSSTKKRAAVKWRVTVLWSLQVVWRISFLIDLAYLANKMFVTSTNGRACLNVAMKLNKVVAGKLTLFPSISWVKWHVFTPTQFYLFIFFTLCY